MHSAALKPERAFSPRILIVDDSLDNVRSLAVLFFEMGYCVDYAINGAAALDMAVSMQPDVIFLDILLPDGHGANVCQQLRRHPVLSQSRIYGVTASGRLLDHQLALDAGCNDVLRKPVAPATFERLINGGQSRRKLREFLSTKTQPTPK